ncbi:MAG: TonB-dependent receptor [Prevotella sp.]|nr:TonB-dependent receptor [Prevotella sp.]
MKRLPILLMMQAVALTAVAIEVPGVENLGAVRGRIVDGSKEVLPGASVYIESLKTGAVSDVNGFYDLGNLKPGTYEVTVRYVGYSPVTTTITVTSGRTLEHNIVMNEGMELKEVQVNGAFHGHRKALNMQKNSMGVTNVVSADQVGKFPDSNIGDALKRINGINVQYDQGEARFGQVRGTSADLSSVTLDGNRIPSAEGDTRNVQLDLIPADMVQTIEVNKVVTADMDGDAIGGSINLVTKSTPYHRVLNVTAGTGLNAVSGKMEKELGFTWGDRFFNKKLGMMFAASYQFNPGGSDNTEFTYDVDDNNSVYLDKAEVRQYYVTRQRQSYSFATDYQFSADHKIGFRAMYNRRHDWENRYRITYKKLGEKSSKQSMVLQTKAGSDDNRNARLELQQTMDFALEGEHHFGKLKLDWTGTYSRATEDRPNERYMGVVIKGKSDQNVAFFDGLDFADEGGRQPYATSRIGDVNDYKWSIDELTNSNQNIYENEWKFRLNFTLPLKQGLYGNVLKFGGKYVSKEKDKQMHCFDYIDAYEEAYGDGWMENMAGQIRSGFMAGDNYPVGTPFVRRQYLGQIDFSKLQGTELYSEAAGNFHAREQVTSAYLRFDQRLDEQLSLTAGLRMEHTALKYSGYNWIVDDATDENGRLIPTGDNKNDYTNFLPSILLKYTPQKDWNIRASFTETLSRPKYSALIPNVSYSVADEEAMIGNPTLKATTSYNFDLSTDYYFESVGLVSLGMFYKRLNNVIVNEVWKSTTDPNIPTGLLNADGETPKYQITKPINAYDARLFGVEVAYERDFGFIAPALKCIGFYGTYTYTHSSTLNHKFEHRSVDDASDVKMTGSPEHTANASLYFEKSGVNVRLSWNTASSFIDELGTVAELDRYYDSVNYLDLNASYTWGRQTKFTVYANATNLLNQPLRYYQGTKDRTMQSEYYGVKVNAGVKIVF